MKKLESLKDSKFQAFNQEKLEDVTKIRGGVMIGTKLHYTNGSTLLDRYSTEERCTEFLRDGVWTD